MIHKSLNDVATMANGVLNDESLMETYIDGVSTDTRTITDGCLFIPLIGENFDGHNFVNDAFEKGALCSFWQKDKPHDHINGPIILVEDTHKAMINLARKYRESIDMKVIAITGSNGKTTTKDIITSLLSEKYKVQKTLGNYNNNIGLPKTLFTFDEDCEVGVLELGMENFHEISELTSIAQPDIAIMTNIGDSHLNNLKTKENIARAKFEILEGLKEDGVFIYNGDDEILKKIVKEFKLPEKTYTFGVNQDNDYIIEPIKYDETGNTFNLNEHMISVPLLGEHQMYNGACAVIVAKLFGLEYTDFAKGLASTNLELTGMRNELKVFADFSILNDSYKSNPQSLNAGLGVVYSMTDYSRKIAIIGDMMGLGDEEIQIHKNIGMSIDPEKIDYILTIGESAFYLFEQAKNRFPENHVFHFNTKDEVVEKAKELIIKDTLVFVKASRPMELETIVHALEDYKL